MFIASCNRAKFQMKGDQESFLPSNAKAHPHTAYAFLHIPALKHQIFGSSSQTAHRNSWATGSRWPCLSREFEPDDFRAPFQLQWLYDSMSSYSFTILCWFSTYPALQVNSESSITRCFRQVAHYKFFVSKARKAIVLTSYIERCDSASPQQVAK